MFSPMLFCDVGAPGSVVKVTTVLSYTKPLDPSSPTRVQQAGGAHVNERLGSHGEGSVVCTA